MSTTEQTGTIAPINLSVKSKSRESILTSFLKLLCSVRFGIALLILLALACTVGMLIMQENIEGFGSYYTSLTPAQRLVYGNLGFFDIYHTWYFNALIAILSLNIILSSIDRFPKTQRFISKRQLTAPLRWLRSQKQTDSFAAEGEKEELVDRIKKAYEKAGWRKTFVTEKNGQTFVLGESGVWNRFAYLAVHIGLLTIFLGGFMTTQLGQTGNMPLTPGETSNEISEATFDLGQINEVTKRLPFEIICTDIQQKLIKEDGSISASNTIDWITRFKIKDETGTHDAFVQMNRPFDYRGYRFFQASFTSIGRARNITVRAVPANGGAMKDITIPRDGATALPDGTKIEFAEFRGNFAIGQENLNEDTSSYPNPGAVLRVSTPEGKTQTAYAFGEQMASMPVAKNPVAGYTYQLIDFEKVSDRHILSLQRDPGANVVYIGFTLLFLTLTATFFFSHQRVWAAIDETSENKFNVILGGNTNRNQNAFSEKFNRFVQDLREIK